MSKIKAIWDIMRLEHGFMLFIAILVGSIISQKILYNNILEIPLKSFILTFFTAMFLESSTFALNDYFDFEIDKKNKRTDRPLVRGDIKPKTALSIFFVFFPIGIICSYFVNIVCFFIALITAFFAVLYDSHMKKIKLVGNFYIAYIMAIPFVFGAAAVLPNNILSFNIDPSIFIIAFIAFLAGSGREIMKDVQDFEGDKEKGVRSFPKYIGKRKSNIIAGIFYIIAILISLFPFFFNRYEIYFLNMAYFLPVLICDTMLLGTSLQLFVKKEPNLKIYRKFTLIAIFIGLLAFLMGALFRL